MYRERNLNMTLSVQSNQTMPQNQMAFKSKLNCRLRAKAQKSKTLQYTAAGMNAASSAIVTTGALMSDKMMLLVPALMLGILSISQFITGHSIGTKAKKL